MMILKNILMTNVVQNVVTKCCPYCFIKFKSFKPERYLPSGGLSSTASTGFKVLLPFPLGRRICKVLLQYGADPNTCSSTGTAVLDCAATFADKPLMEVYT